MSSPNSVFVFTRDPELGNELRDTLALWRLGPLVFRDPSALLYAASQRAPAALVVDSTVSDVDALDLVRALRQHPATADVVAVAVLEDLRPDGVELAASRGCDRVTARPVDPDWIGAEIDRVWSRRWARAA